MHEWLKSRDQHHRMELRSYLSSIAAELSMAMTFLRQINSEDWHDRLLIEGEELSVLRFIDRVLHPTYLRLVEGVLAPLIRPVAYFSRLDRGKKAEGLDVYNSVQELAGGPMSACVEAYHHTVRNGIGHGGITYQQNDIRYRDKKGNTETLNVWSVVRMCDDLVDTCNALSCALKVFLMSSRSSGYQLPSELLVEELVEETRTPWWTIGGCIETRLPGGSQLIVYARPESRDRQKVLWSAVQSAALAESFAPGHDRYFLSLRGSRSWPGWAVFDGARLRQLRESGAKEVHEYVTAFTSPGFFYVPTPPLPRLLCSLDTRFQSIRLHWPAIQRQMRQNLGRPLIIGREGRMHRNAWGYVLHGAVVMPELTKESAAAAIRASKRRILRKASAAARATTPAFDLARYLPLGYARVGVFSHDIRRRRLASFGLGPELICTVQLQRIRRIQSPDIMGSTIEISGNWRIA